MITYFDTSTIIKLLIEETGSDKAEFIWESSPILASATLVNVEARAALAVAERGRRLTVHQHRDAKADLALLLNDLNMVEVNEALIELAADLAEEHGLRGYDAVHLAAAMTVGADVITSADTALCDAAERCLPVANPLDN